MKIKDFFKIVFIAFLACVALTACGGDDDEPDTPSTAPSASFLYGTWSIEDTGVEITFNSNGTLTGFGHPTYYYHHPEYRGSWSYKNGKLNVIYNVYDSNNLLTELPVEAVYKVNYDNYINKLILIVESSNYGGDFQIYGQYAKKN